MPTGYLHLPLSFPDLSDAACFAGVAHVNVNTTVARLAASTLKQGSASLLGFTSASQTPDLCQP